MTKNEKSGESIFLPPGHFTEHVGDADGGNRRRWLILVRQWEGMVRGPGQCRGSHCPMEGTNGVGATLFSVQETSMVNGPRSGLLQLQGSLGGDCVVHTRIPIDCSSWRHKPLVVDGLQLGATTGGNH